MLEIKQTKNHKIIAELNEEVQNLHFELHPEMFKPYNKLEMELALEKFLSDENCRAYLVVENEKPIGCAVFFIREAKENAFHHTIKTIYIDQISVLKQHQKSGAGKLLMDQAEKLAKELSINKIELDHWSTNIVAAKYFRKQGYNIHKERLFKMI